MDTRQRGGPPPRPCAAFRNFAANVGCATVEPMSGLDAAGAGNSRQADPVEPAGMGANPSGPEFLSAAQSQTGETLPPPTAAVRTPPSKQGSRVPDLISVALIAVVALIVLVASAIARYGDTHLVAPAPEPTIRPEHSTPNEIEFVTPNGRGRLLLLSRNWLDTGREPPAYGSYLQLEVRIICTAGHLGYDPYNFQAFDHTGELFDVAEAGVTENVLGVGELFEGDSVDGYLAFDIPRGEVTLLMSDDTEVSITALKVPD